MNIRDKGKVVIYHLRTKKRNKLKVSMQLWKLKKNLWVKLEYA